MYKDNFKEIILICHYENKKIVKLKLQYGVALIV